MHAHRNILSPVIACGMKAMSRTGMANQHDCSGPGWWCQRPLGGVRRGVSSPRDERMRAGSTPAWSATTGVASSPGGSLGMPRTGWSGWW